jgi:hypothetical protein
MAYIVTDARVNAPYRYTEATGDIARYDTDENELAVNERGAPLEAFFVLGQGDLIYKDEADYNSLSDEEKSGASEILQVVNKRWLSDHTRLGSIKELEAKASAAKGRGGKKRPEPVAAESNNDENK